MVSGVNRRTSPAPRAPRTLGRTVRAGGIGIVFSFAIFALELLVGAIQAYIFTVLTAQYVASSIAESH